MKYLLSLTMLIGCISFTACSQSVKLASTTPTSIPAHQQENKDDSGIREFNILLDLRGKSKRNVPLSLKLKVSPGSKSAPQLIDSVIVIDKIAFKYRQIQRKVRIKLAPVRCLQSDEDFLIVPRDTTKVSGENKVIVKAFAPTIAVPTIELKEDTSVIKPFLASDPDDDGVRYIKTILILSGPPPARDTPIVFNIPLFTNSASSPSIQTLVRTLIKPSAFTQNDGCPVKIPINQTILLKSIAKYSREEQRPIMIVGNDKHAHMLRIWIDTLKRDTTPPKGSVKPGPTFTFSCSPGNTFIVTIKKDSITLTHEKSKETHTFTYNLFFHRSDFAIWVSNSFLNVTKTPCNDCAFCSSYLADRVSEELSAAQQTTSGKDAITTTTISSGSVKTDAAVDTSKSKTKEKNDSTISTKTKSPTTDTTSYKQNFNYPDSVLYGMTIQSTSSNTASLTICKDSNKSSKKCETREIAGPLSFEVFKRNTTDLLKKINSTTTVEDTKITPSLEAVFAQYQKAYNKQNPPEKTADEKLVDTAKSKIGNDPFSETELGTVYLKDSLISIYDTAGVFIKKVKIDSLTFAIEGGKIVKRSMFVETSDGTFTNKDAPIPVRRINDRENDKLWNMDLGPETFMRLGDLLKYRPKGNYVPDDVDQVVLKPSAKSKKLSAASNLNSLINFSLYTDLVGLLGRKPNGLLNTDITGKFLTNTGNVKNIDLTFFSFIEPNIVLSKFDSKFKSLDSSAINTGKNGQLDTVDRMQLIQQAWLKASIKFNVASFRFLSNQYIQVNIGARINAVNADSIYKKETDILYFDYYPEAVYSINRLNNFGMEASVKWLLQRLADKENFSNKKAEWVFNPQISFYYFPTSNINNRLYLRFNYFAGRSKTANSFYQLQFGWKSGLRF